MKTIFLHIPKAGGTTVFDNLKFQRDKREVFVDYSVDHKDSLDSSEAYHALSSSRRAAYKYFIGHIGYHEKLYGGGADWVTILRNPIDRVVSNYKHIMRVGSKNFPDKSISLIDFVKDSSWRDSKNGQVRRISGCDIRSQYYKTDFSVGAEELELAKKHLRKFKFVGISETLTSQLERIGSAFNLEYMYKIRSNASPDWQARSLNDDELQVLREYNALDIELYEYAKVLNTNRYSKVPLPRQVTVHSINSRTLINRRTFEITHKMNKVFSLIPGVGKKLWSWY